MDEAVIKEHWAVVKMAAVHRYIPDKSHGAMQALVVAYKQRVDTSCGNCLFEMMERMYNNYKSEFGE